MDVTTMPVIGKVTVDIYGKQGEKEIHLHSVYNVIKIITRPEGKYYVTDQIYETHADGYQEPLVISDLIATNYESIGA